MGSGIGEGKGSLPKRKSAWRARADDGDGREDPDHGDRVPGLAERAPVGGAGGAGRLRDEDVPAPLVRDLGHAGFSRFTMITPAAPSPGGVGIDVAIEDAAVIGTGNRSTRRGRREQGRGTPKPGPP